MALSHLQFFKVRGSNCVKLWALDEYSGAFPNKVTSDIYFTKEVLVQYDVPDVKILFLGTGNLQMITNIGANSYGWLMYCFWNQFCI